MSDIKALIERLEKATGPDRELDAAIWAATLPRDGVGIDGYGLPDGAHYEYRPCEDGRVEMLVSLNGERGVTRANRPSPEYTASLDAAVALVEKVLPGWWWQIGSCHVSDDARLCPDFGSPVHGERLLQQFGQIEGYSDPSVYWQELTDVDLRPSGRPAIALCLALLRAKEGT
jgi:hypothetical protein